jgi:hypothetical protein
MAWRKIYMGRHSRDEFDEARGEGGRGGRRERGREGGRDPCHKSSPRTLKNMFYEIAILLPWLVGTKFYMSSRSDLD